MLYIENKDIIKFSITTKMSSTFNRYRNHLSVPRLNIKKSINSNKINKIILSRKNPESNVIFN